ncbi:MAG: hypothetical protein ACC726_14230 [Chloroflexota bacterium]
MPFFVDTNVIVYAATEGPYHIAGVRRVDPLDEPPRARLLRA